MKRRPRGYVGLGHETIGSDIIAVLESVRMAEIVLGAERTAVLRTIDAAKWYPIATLLEPLEFIEAKLGESSLKKVGWQVFKVSHAATFAQTATSARDVAYGIDQLYHHANRGQGIGGWAVTKFEPGHAQLEKTTPHPCVMEEGILEEALRALHVPCSVTQSQCLLKGHDLCVFELASAVRDARWSP